MADVPSAEELERLLAAPEHQNNPLLPVVAALAEQNRDRKSVV